jgi:Lipopolysaccharide kinase (Kdo/WaaP) family
MCKWRRAVPGVGESATLVCDMSLRILYASAPEWAAAASRIDEMIGGPDFHAVKLTARTAAGFINTAGAHVFVKRVCEYSWPKGWLINLCPSRARRVLRGAAMLEAGGFAHPRPLAAAEFVRLGAIRASVVISEALADAEILSTIALAGGRRTFRRRIAISHAVAREIRRLHEAGIYTRDLQETNLMLRGGPEGPWTIYFVDLEDFRRVRTVSHGRRMLNLVHLDRTIGRFLPRSQRVRFFYYYLGAKPPRAEARRRVAQFLALRTRIDVRARLNDRSIGTPAIGPAAPHSRVG